jgi:hypothetical protein
MNVRAVGEVQAVAQLHGVIQSKPRAAAKANLRLRQPWPRRSLATTTPAMPAVNAAFERSVRPRLFMPASRGLFPDSSAVLNGQSRLAGTSPFKE